jgi:hypothetical protein
MEADVMHSFHALELIALARRELPAEPTHARTHHGRHASSSLAKTRHRSMLLTRLFARRQASAASSTTSLRAVAPNRRA